MMKNLLFYCFIASTLLLTACSSNLDWKTAALNPGHSDTTHIKHNLVFFDVNIESAKPGIYYKLNDIWGIEKDSGRDFRFPLFDNFIMGSEDVPYSLEGNNLQQTVFMDLPPGSYQIYKMDILALHLRDTLSNEAGHRLYPPLLLKVQPGGASYFGAINLKVLGIEQQGDYKKANLNITVSRPTRQGREQIAKKFPALSNASIRDQQIAEEF